MSGEPEFHFDESTQREVLVDPEAARDWVRTLEEQGLIGDPMRVVWLRILGRIDEAEALGWEVLERSGGPGTAAAVPNCILPLTSVTAAVRLGHVLQWKGDFDTAHLLYGKSLAALESVEALAEDSAYADYLRPFAYQHIARCYYDQGDYRAAIDASQRAAELRRNAGVPKEQLLVSEGLISAARARLEDSAIS